MKTLQLRPVATSRPIAVIVWLGLALTFLTPPQQVHAAPALSVEPTQGRCIVTSPPLTVRGAGLPAGLSVSIVVYADDAATSPPGFPIGAGMVQQDGSLAIEGLRFRCPAELVEGGQHTLAVLPASDTRRARADALATATFITSAIPPPIPPDERQCFAETGQCITGRFLAYWRYNGGLERHGYPLTGERRERLEDGHEYTVQYFERTRLEYHPENPPPYDILIGLLGSRFSTAEPPVAPSPRVGPDVTSQAQYFSETGHNLVRFRYYWTQHGGVDIFGLPIGEERLERLEDGNEYTVQYFERARLEWHPDAPGFRVVVGQFGRRALTGGQP